MKASQLRDLTRDFAAGKIGQQEYLAERTRLIDGIVAGEIEIRYRDLEPAATPAGHQRQRWYGVAMIALVGLLLVAVLAHFLTDAPPRMPSVEQPRQPPVAKNPGVELLARANSEPEWSDATLADFEAAWSALTPFQQENARRSAAYRQLRHETTRRIREQEALLAAGEMDALVRAVRLREFGERMGFSTER